MPLNTDTFSLTDILSQACNSKTLWVGIGNVLRSDDGAGVYICRKIKENQRASVLVAEVSIENYIGKINSLNPDILVLVDCVNLNDVPGTYKLLGLNDLEDFTFNTHNISLQRLGDFFPMQVYVLGIQPGNLNFGEILSDEVKQSADEIIQLVHDCYENPKQSGKL